MSLQGSQMRNLFARLSKLYNKALDALYLRFNPAKYVERKVSKIGWRWYGGYGRLYNQWSQNLEGMPITTTVVPGALSDAVRKQYMEKIMGVDFGSKDHSVVVTGHKDEQGRIVVDDVKQIFE